MPLSVTPTSSKPQTAPDPRKQMERYLEPAKAVIDQGLDPGEIVKMQRDLEGWDDKDAAAFTQTLDHLSASRDAYRDAVDVFATSTNPKDHAELQKLQGTWDDKKAAYFEAAYQAVQGLSPKERKRILDEDIDMQAVDSYARDLDKMPPVYRDVLLGIYQGRQDLISTIVRPVDLAFGGTTSDEMNRDLNLVEQAAGMADQGAETGPIGEYVRGASRSLYTSAALSPLGGYGIIGGFGAIRGNQAITEATDAGLEGVDKWAYVGRAAAIEAGIAAAFQVTGAGGLEKLLGGGQQLTKAGLKEVLKKTGIALLQELPEGNLTELLDQYNQIASGVDPNEMTWDTALEILKKTTIQTALTVGASGAYKGVSSQKMLRNRDATIKQLSESYGMDPERIAELMDKAQKRSDETGRGFTMVLGRELENAHLETEAGAADWARAHPNEAKKLVDGGISTRKAFTGLQLPKMDASHRAWFIEAIKPTVQEATDKRMAERSGRIRTIERARAKADADVARTDLPTPPADLESPESIERQFQSKADYSQMVDESLDLSAAIKKARDAGDLAEARDLNEQLMELNRIADRDFSREDRTEFQPAVDPEVLRLANTPKVRRQAVEKKATEESAKPLDRKKLKGMSKKALVQMAQDRGVELKEGASRAQVISALAPPPGADIALEKKYLDMSEDDLRRDLISGKIPKNQRKATIARLGELMKPRVEAKQKKLDLEKEQKWLKKAEDIYGPLKEKWAAGERDPAVLTKELKRGYFLTVADDALEAGVISKEQRDSITKGHEAYEAKLKGRRDKAADVNKERGKKFAMEHSAIIEGIAARKRDAFGDEELQQKVRDRAKEKIAAGEYNLKAVKTPKQIERVARRAAADALKEIQAGEEAGQEQPAAKEEDAPKPAKQEKPKSKGAKAVRVAEKSAESAGQIRTMKVDEIELDPERFQYKQLHRQGTGETGSLEGVEVWNPNLAGIISVWRDPADGKVYVVNGHNRLAKAQALGVKNIDVRLLESENAEAARADGALINIAEGMGTPIDAAKFFRDTGTKPDDLRGMGIPLTQAIAEKGLALSQLTGQLFNDVARGDMTVEQGAIIGRVLQEPHLQNTVVRMLKKRKNMTNQTLEELVDLTKNAETVESDQFSLLGDDPEMESLAVEVAKLMAGIKSSLLKEKKVLSVAGRPQTAEILEKAGSKIAVGQSKKLSKDAAYNLGLFNAYKRTKPIMDVVNEGARRIKDGESAKDVKAEVYKRVRQALQEADPSREADDASLFEMGDRERQSEAVQAGGIEVESSLFDQDAEPAPKKGAMAGRSMGPRPAYGDTTVALNTAEMLRVLKRAGVSTPKIVSRINIMSGNAAGVFRASAIDPTIELRADIFTGPILTSGTVRDADVDAAISEVMGTILSERPDLTPDDIEIKKKPSKKRRGYQHITFYEIDDTYAGRVLAHEIGHWDDFEPDKDLKRGNILGRIAKLREFAKTAINELPPAGEENVPADLRKRAKELAGKRPKEKGPELDAWKDRYAEELDRLAAAAGIVTRDTITRELKALTRWWSPFDPLANDKYTKYRHSSVELYAEALSVMFNAPGELRRRAPVFYHAWQQYKEQSSEVRALYDEVYNEIMAGTSASKLREDVRAAHRSGDEAKRAELEKAKTPTSTFRDTIGTLFADRFYRLIRLVKRAKKQGFKGPNPQDTIDVAKYSGSQIEHYVERISRDVMIPLEKAGLTEADLGEYLHYQRAINERSKLANPVVGDAKSARGALDAMKKALGSKMDVLEQARQRFRKLREEMILSAVRKSEMYGPEFMRFLEDNEHYATFEVVKFIEKNAGKGTGAKMFRQVGTFQDISNPLSATMETDISLIWNANWNAAKIATADFLQKVYPDSVTQSSMTWNGKKQVPVETTERGKGTIVFQRAGQLQGIDVESYIAKAFDKSFDERTSGFVRVLRALSNPARMWFTTVRPGFQVFNAFYRDPKRTIRHLPGAGILNIYPKLFESLKAAGLEMIGRPDAMMDEMRRRGLMISWSNISGLDEIDTQTERILAKYSGSGRWTAEITKPLQKWWARFLSVGELGERANKRAAFAFLKQNQKKLGWSDDQVDHAVRHWAGSPSFITGGSASPVTNNLLMFSNAMIQGWRSDIEALKANPRSVLIKTLVYSVAPKAIMAALARGAMGALFRALGAPEDDEWVEWADWFPKAYAKIGSYHMTNYTVIPVGETPSGKVIAIRIPDDETGRVAGGAVWRMLNAGDTTNLLQDTISYLGDQGPGLNPLIDAAISTYQYMTGVNPYDSFRRRTAVPEREFSAGGWDSHKAYLKWFWNNYGGSFIWKASTDNPLEVKTQLQEFLQLPFMGDLAGRFVLVSDYGLAEKAKEEVAAARSEKDRVNIKVEDVVHAKLAGQKLTAEDEQILRENSDVATRYEKMMKQRGGTAVSRALTAARSHGEMRRALMRLKKESPGPALDVAIEQFASRQLWYLGAPPAKRDKGEALESFQTRQAKREIEIAEAAEMLEGLISLEDVAAVRRLVKLQYDEKTFPFNAKSGRMTPFGARSLRAAKRLGLIPINKQ